MFFIVYFWSDSLAQGTAIFSPWYTRGDFQVSDLSGIDWHLLEPTEKGREFEQQMGDTLVAIVNGLLTDSDIKTCQRVCKDLKRLRDLIEAYQS